MPRRRSPYSLLKRGNVFYVRVWDSERGQYSTARSTGETTRGAAQVKAAQMINEGLTPVIGQPLAVDYAIERLKGSGTSQKYISEGLVMLDKHVKTAPVFSHLKLAAVQGKHLNRLIDHLKKKGLSPRTINRVLAYITPALKAAYRRGFIARDPVAGGVEKQPENLRKRGSLTADEIKKILAMPPARDPRYKAYMVTAILTGMRKGELRALRWHDVDTGAGVIRVRQSYTDQGGLTKPKTADSVREIPLLKPVRDALEEMRERSPYSEPSDFVFYQANRETPLPGHFFEKAFRSVLDAISIDAAERERRHLVPHSTRHSFVTFCRTLLPDFIVGGMSGHSTTSMIDLYGRAGSEHFRTARDVLNAALTVKPDGDDQIH